MKNTLKESGYTLESIPNINEKIILRHNANLSTGGKAIDCTDDICGVDITANTIKEPLCDQGVIMEINAAPGIRMHHHPSEGKIRNVGEKIVKHLYKDNVTNIPVISVTGTNGKTTTTRLISYVLKLMGNTVGMTSTDGIYIGDECIDIGDDTGYESAKAILLNKDVDAAVLETARGGIIKKGLAYDLADVGVITNITGDHLGLDDINDLEELSFVKSLIVEAVKPDGYAVINVDDPWSRKIIDRIKGNAIYFSKDKDNDISVFIEDDMICVVNNNKKYNVIKLSDVPITLDGKLSFNIENALAACAALVGIGIDYCMIARGFSKFMLDAKHNSGRFNLYEINERKVILDYGHNTDGYRAIFKALLEFLVIGVMIWLKKSV